MKYKYGLPISYIQKKKRTSLQKTTIEGNKDSKHEKCVLKGKETL